MKLMTVWNAYRQASIDIRVFLRKEEALIDTSQYRSARLANDKMMRRLRQKAKFNKYITGRISQHDDDLYKRAYELKCDQFKGLLQNYWQLGSDWGDARRWSAAWKAAARKYRFERDSWRKQRDLCFHSRDIILDEVGRVKRERDELINASEKLIAGISRRDERIAELEFEYDELLSKFTKHAVDNLSDWGWLTDEVLAAGLDEFEESIRRDNQNTGEMTDKND